MIAKELTAKPCDTGSSVSVLSLEFPQFEFRDLDPVFPDKTSPAAQFYAYNRTAALRRAQLSLEKLYKRPERIIAVVSHSAFLRQAVSGQFFGHADYRIFDLNREHHGETEVYALAEWRSTNKNGGGMGRSLKDVVKLGEGIPVTSPPST